MIVNNIFLKSLYSTLVLGLKRIIKYIANKLFDSMVIYPNNSKGLHRRQKEKREREIKCTNY